MAKIILDCDGVLSNLVDHLFAELSERGFRVPEQLEQYELFDVLGDDARDIAQHLFSEGSFWNEIPRYEDAAVAIDAIKAAGHDIVVVTSPWPTCVGWEFCRRAWLMRNFQLFPKRVIVASEKHHVHGDVFVDDKIGNVRAWQKAWPNGRAFLMNRSWTKKEDASCPRIDWSPAGIEELLSVARSSSSATSGS